VCGAALEPTVGRGWTDVERGVFYRRPQAFVRPRNAARAAAPGLSAHLRRWKRRGQRFAVEWKREAVGDIGKPATVRSDSHC